MADDQNGQPEKKKGGGFNPFQKIDSMEAATDNAKAGAVVTAWLAISYAIQIIIQVTGNQPLFNNADMSDKITWYSVLITNALFLLIALWFTWAIWKKQRLWVIVITLIWVLFEVTMKAMAAGAQGMFLSLIMVVVAILSLRGAIAMRRLRKQAPPPSGD